jgi:S1-C subfamily serine protease
MKKLALAVMAVVLTACSITPSIPNYRALAKQVVPTNVELVAEVTNVFAETKSDVTYCSGTAITPTHIITAGHCLNGPANEETRKFHFGEKGDLIKVRLQDGSIYFAKVVTSILTENTKTGMDAALLVLDEPVLKNIAVLGDSDSVRQGDFIAIVGNPFGALNFSFNVGYVGFVDRELPDTGHFLQAYLESRGGNSGGAAFNDKGELIGIVVRSDRAGITFIVPLNEAIVALAADLTAKEKCGS